MINDGFIRAIHLFVKVLVVVKDKKRPPRQTDLSVLNILVHSSLSLLSTANTFE